METSEIMIESTPKAIFDVLASAEAMSSWLPMVERCEAKGPRGIGGERHCEVEWDGKRGRIVERCTERVMRRRLAFVVEEETLGFTKMYDLLGFAYDLTPLDGERTCVRMEGFYRPRGVVGLFVDAVLMRRRLARSRRDILGHLKRHIESKEKRPRAEPTGVHHDPRRLTSSGHPRAARGRGARRGSA